MQLALFRWLGVAILVLPILIKRFSNIIAAIKSNFIILSILSILGIATFNTLLYVGLNYTTATNALLINSFIPVLILVFSYFILKIKVNIKQLIGILLSTCGVIFIVVKGEITHLSQIQFNHGDFWIISSSVTWALYTVLVKFKPKSLNDFEFFTTIVYMGLFWLVLVYSFMGYSPSSDIILYQKYYYFFIYVAVFPSVLSYYFWHQGIRRIGANRAGQFAHLMPLFGATLAYIFLGERLHSYHIMGAILIAIGIYLSLFSKPKQRSA
jgi:drug/metabolite transporter (DMT)-like permease